jgi:hypothetical protein
MQNENNIVPVLKKLTGVYIQRQVALEVKQNDTCISLRGHSNLPRIKLWRFWRTPYKYY